MSKHCYFSKSFWDDEWVQEQLNPAEKLIYLYLITSPMSENIGVYKIANRRIAFDTGYDVETVKAAIDKFSAAKKAIRFKEWIIIPSSPKHQNLNNLNFVKGMISELNELPDEVFEELEAFGYKFDFSLLSLSEEELAAKITGKKKKKGKDSSPSQDTPIIEVEFESKFKSKFVVDGDPENSCEQIANNGEDKPPPPPTTTNAFNIQKEAKAVGYFISKRQASAFFALDSSWLSGNHSFFEFSARKIRDDPVYSAKSPADRERIFAKGWKYENWIQEYPDWLKEQIKDDERKALERLKTSPPEICPHCGSDMEGYSCPSCNGYVKLNEEKRSWEYQEPVNHSLVELLRNRKMAGDKNKPP
jgi:hypothetical protein